MTKHQSRKLNPLHNPFVEFGEDYHSDWASNPFQSADDFAKLKNPLAVYKYHYGEEVTPQPGHSLVKRGTVAAIAILTVVMLFPVALVLAICFFDKAKSLYERLKNYIKPVALPEELKSVSEEQSTARIYPNLSGHLYQTKIRIFPHLIPHLVKPTKDGEENEEGNRKQVPKPEQCITATSTSKNRCFWLETEDALEKYREVIQLLKEYCQTPYSGCGFFVRPEYLKPHAALVAEVLDNTTASIAEQAQEPVEFFVNAIRTRLASEGITLTKNDDLEEILTKISEQPFALPSPTLSM